MSSNHYGSQGSGHQHAASKQKVLRLGGTVARLAREVGEMVVNMMNIAQQNAIMQ